MLRSIWLGKLQKKWRAIKLKGLLPSYVYISDGKSSDMRATQCKKEEKVLSEDPKTRKSYKN